MDIEINPLENIPAAAPAKSTKRNPAIIAGEIATAVVLFLILAYFSLNWMMDALIHSRAEAQVPNLKGTSLISAVDKLAMLQLALIKDGEEFNDSLPEGSILRQMPMPGTKVREGKIIHVVLSKGGERLFIPDVIGKQLRLADINLRQSNLGLGEVAERHSLKYEKGTIIEQDPRPGAVADRNALVNIIISAGQPQNGIVLMPDFTNKKIDDAKQWAQENNVSMGPIIPDPHSSVPTGEIIKQIPQPDAVLERSDRVEFVVGVSTTIAKADRVWYYALPQGSDKRYVKIVLIDDLGEHIIFKGLKLPGSKLEIPYFHRSNARISIYLDNILVEDKEL